VSETILKLADAVTKALNDHAFSVAFVAERKYLDVSQLEESESIRVRVFPAQITTEIDTRNSTRDTYAIAITVLQRAAEIDQLDPLVKLVHEIANYLRFRTLADFPAAHWIGVEIAPVFDPKRLNETRQFLSQIAVRYRVRHGA
jgi:hypothetical protein